MRILSASVCICMELPSQHCIARPKAMCCMHSASQLWERACHRLVPESTAQADHGVVRHGGAAALLDLQPGDRLQDGRRCGCGHAFSLPAHMSIFIAPAPGSVPGAIPPGRVRWVTLHAFFCTHASSMHLESFEVGIPRIRCNSLDPCLNRRGPAGGGRGHGRLQRRGHGPGQLCEPGAGPLPGAPRVRGALPAAHPVLAHVDRCAGVHASADSITCCLACTPAAMAPCLSLVTLSYMPYGAAPSVHAVAAAVMSPCKLSTARPFRT